MRLVVDPALDGEVWSGRPTGPEVGLARVGARGLFRALAPRVGRSARTPPEGQRLARLAALLVENEGFWSDSAAQDPLGVAAQLLAARDALVWGGAVALEGRPGALLELCARAPGGFADRARAIVDAIDDDLEVESVELLAPREGLPALARAALAKLEAAGVTVSWRPLRAAVAEAEVGDGRVFVARPGGPLEAGERTARWIARSVDAGVHRLEDFVIIGPTASLDAALTRLGLPRPGARGWAGAREAALVLALLATRGSRPSVGAARALVRRAPLAPDTRGALLRALDEWPAVFSAPWEAAADDEVRALFPADDAAGWRPARHRLALAARLLGAESPFVGRLRALFELARPLAAEPDETLLVRLVELALRDLGPRWRAAPEAGLRFVGAPGAVIAPAPVVVWVDALDPGEGARAPWSTAERAALARAGVDVELDRELELRRARRAVDQAERLFLAVAPRRREDGDEAAAHAVVEELLARSGGRETGWPAPGPEAGPRRRLGRTPRLPAPRGEAELRAPGSPTAVERLLGCPLRYALGRVAPPHAAPEAARVDERRAVGAWAHEVVAARLLEEIDDADLEAHVASTGPRRAAGLYAADREEERRGVEAAIARAARGLASLLASAGARVVSVEEASAGEVDGLALEGRPDLVVELAGERVVVDLKWGGAGYRRRALATGQSVQLASYGAMTGAGSAAYFILSEALLLLAGQAPLEGERAAEAPPSPEGIGERVRAALEELAGGAWRAAPLEDEAEDPPCAFCAWDLVCGRGLR